MSIPNKQDNRILFLIGGCLGAVLFLCIFGWDKLDVTYIDWLLRDDLDLTQHYMGWCTYRASDWHFPLGLMDHVLYPDSVSVFFTDSIPLFAFLFKLLSGILPEQFQYFGIFGLLCYFLQGAFATVLIYHYTQNKIYSVLGSLFFSGSLLMMWRMFTHTALSAHCLILAALYLWLCKDQTLILWKRILFWTLLSLSALMIQAYFLPMVWGCMLCSMLSILLKDRTSAAKNIRHSLMILLIAGSTTLLCGFSFGMFYGDMPVSGESYGIFSFNLNGFFNSQGLTRFLPALPLSTPYQVEGLAYLGLGILLLLLVSAIAGMIYLRAHIHDSKNTPDMHIMNTTQVKEFLYSSIPYIIFVLVFTSLSLGIIITFGTHQLTLPIPETLRKLLAIFRCSGRLIWPVYYLILLAACILPIRYIQKSWIPMVLLSVCLILQSIDLSSYIHTRIVKFHTPDRMTYESPLTDPVWEECAMRYQHITYYPDVYTLYSTRKNEGYAIQIFAYRHSMTLNYIYFSRNLSPSINENVYQQFRQRADLSAKTDTPDTMYIFLDQVPVGDYGLHYYYVNDILIGTPDRLEHGTELFFDTTDSLMEPAY